MKKLAIALWQDDCGMIISAELVLVATLGVLGMVAGLSHVRGAVVEEYKDLGDSLRSINQSYSYSGFSGCKAFTAGSAFLEDCEEPVIHFETIYEGCETPCETPCENGCPPADEIIIERQILPTPCHDCLPKQVIERGCCPPQRCRGELLVPMPALEAIPEIEAEAEYSEPETTVCVEDFVPAPKFTREEYESPPLCYDHPESIYNVRRYCDSPYHPIAPFLTPRSSVW